MGMKFSTLKRHFREGFKNIIRNGWMSVASIGAVTVTLVLVGTFITLMLNINQMTVKVEEDVKIKTLIDVTADDAVIKKLGEQIEAIPGVHTIEFSSKDDEFKSLIEDMGEQGKAWELYEQDNPLNHAYIVQTEIPQDTERVAKEIEKLEYVYKVNYGQDVVPKLFKFNNYVRTVGIILIAGLVLTAIFLISNTIKLTIMARSTEIGIMKLVGATNSFIRWPFFIEGMLLGILGSIIPILVITIGYSYIYDSVVNQTAFPFVSLMPLNPFLIQISAAIVIIGAVIGMWGSGMSVRKFLKV